MRQRPLPPGVTVMEKEARIAAIVSGDRIYELYGMELLAAEDGLARIRAPVREEFLNAHRIAHGALIFAVLDVAFALAVNAVEDAVGVQFAFNIFRSADLGDAVIGEARIIHRGKRSLVVELKAASETSGKLLAQGNATALPVLRKKQPGA